MATRKVIFGGRKLIPRTIHKFRMWRNDRYKRRADRWAKREHNRAAKEGISFVICHHCGMTNETESNYCHECGGKLKAGGTSKGKKKRAINAYEFIKSECRHSGDGCGKCVYFEIYGDCPFLGLPYNWNL